MDDLLNESVAVRRPGALDANGNRSYGDALSTFCRIELKEVTKWTGTGLITIADARGFFSAEDDIDVDHRVTWQSREFVVVKCELLRFPSGDPSHKEVLLRYEQL